MLSISGLQLFAIVFFNIWHFQQLEDSLFQKCRFYLIIVIHINDMFYQ